MQQRPPSLLGAAAVQAAEALIVVAGSVLAGVDTITGKSYQTGSGIALTLIGLATAAALAWVALGLAGARRWSRTPAALTQLFVGIVGIYLVQGHQYAWGIPALLLACAGLALVLAPASLRALARPQPARPGTPGRRPRPRPCPRRQGRPRPGQPRQDRPSPGRPPSRSRSQQANAPPAASPLAGEGRRAAGVSSPSRRPTRHPQQPTCTQKRASWGFRGLGPPGWQSPGRQTPGQSSPRPSARPGAGPGSWPAAGTRASARSPARSRSATASCSRRTAAAGCAFPGWAAAPAMA